MQARTRFRLVAALLAAAAAGFVSFAVQAAFFPYALDYGEGMMLDAAWRLAAGENIYPRFPVAAPYLVLSYPPLFMAALAPLTAWFGPAYWYGRVIVEVCAAATALCVGMVAAHFAGRRAGVLAALTYPAIPFVAGWAPLVRVDMPALACAWAALAVFFCVRRQGVAIAVSIVLMLAAGFTRQTAWLPACAGIVVHLVARRHTRVLLTYALVLATLAALMAIALQQATGGFWFAVLGSNRLPFTWRQWTMLTAAVGHEIPLLVVIAIVTIGYGARRRAAWAPFAIGYALGTISTIAGAAKAGSTVNYFLDVAALGALTAGLAWDVVERQVAAAAPRWRRALTTMLAVQAAWWIWIGHPFRLEAPAYLDSAFTVVRAEPGPVLADAAVGLLPIAGHRVAIEPFKMSALARANLWDERPFVRDVRTGRFALIVVMLTSGRHDPDQWTPAMWAAIDERYRRCGEIPIDTRVLALYRPSCATPTQ